MVACGREGVEKYYLRYPKLIVEVLSPSTESIDRHEKLLNYAQIPTVEEYVWVSQKKREAALHRRIDEWQPQIIRDAAASVDLKSIGLVLSLVQIYEGVEGL